MFRQVFNPDNLLWRIIASGVDFVGLSLFYVVLCLPVITIGPATAALYYTTVKVFRQGADDGFTLMWKQFRGNLKSGIFATLVCVPLTVAVIYGYTVMYANAAGALGAVMFVAYYLALVIPVGFMIYLFTVMARFSLDIKTLFKNAFIFTLRHLPTTIILVLLVVQLILASVKTWAVLFVAPVGGALLASFFLEKIFMTYLSVEERAAMQGKTLEEYEAAEKKREAYLNRKKHKP